MQSKNLSAVMQFQGKNIAFQEIDGKMMVNATQMAKPFGNSKKPDNWLRTQQARDLINVVSVSHKCATTDLQLVRQGGKNQGTWFQEDVALFFAQWLSPEFYLACNTKLKELLKKEALALPQKYGVDAIVHKQRFYYAYTDVLRALGASTRGSTSGRKAKHPLQFLFLYGRNFITPEYAQLLKGYYDYRNATNQLKLSI
jgi:hypothetical protein